MRPLVLVCLALLASSPACAPAPLFHDPAMTACATEPDFAKQRDVCTRLIEAGGLAGDDPLWARVNRAGARAALGDVEGAFEDTSFVIEKEPGFAPAHYTRGQIWLAENNPEKALSEYDNTLAIMDAWERRVFKTEYNRGPSGKLRTTSLRIPTLLSRSAALERLDRLVEAEADARAANELDPSDPRPYNNLAYIHLRRGDWDKAIGLYRQALAIAPNYGQAASGLRQAELERRRHSTPDRAATP